MSCRWPRHSRRASLFYIVHMSQEWLTKNLYNLVISKMWLPRSSDLIGLLYLKYCQRVDKPVAHKHKGFIENSHNGLNKQEPPNLSIHSHPGLQWGYIQGWQQLYWIKFVCFKLNMCTNIQQKKNYMCALLYIISCFQLSGSPSTYFNKHFKKISLTKSL